MGLTGVALAAAIGGTALVGSSAIGAFGGGGDDSISKDISYKELPGYEESDEAREAMSGKLQEWGGQEGYGAIAPNWDEIWESAKGKVGRYYWGDVGGTGLAGKVKAGAARRGVSESPAIDTLLTQMGQQEGQQLGDMATEQATQKLAFGEQGRQNWYSQMQNMANMKPAYASSGSITTGSGGDTSTSELMGNLGSSMVGLGMQTGQNQWMQNYMQEMLGNSNLGVGGINESGMGSALSQLSF